MILIRAMVNQTKVSLKGKEIGLIGKALILDPKLAKVNWRKIKTK